MQHGPLRRLHRSSPSPSSSTATRSSPTSPPPSGTSSCSAASTGFSTVRSACRGSSRSDWLATALEPRCNFQDLVFSLSMRPERVEELKKTYDPKRITFLLFEQPETQPQVDLLRELYPAAEAREFRSPINGQTLFSMTVDEDAMAAVRAPALEASAPGVDPNGVLRGVRLRPRPAAAGGARRRDAGTGRCASRSRRLVRLRRRSTLPAGGGPHRRSSRDARRPAPDADRHSPVLPVPARAAPAARCPCAWTCVRPRPPLRAPLPPDHLVGPGRRGARGRSRTGRRDVSGLRRRQVGRPVPRPRRRPRRRRARRRQRRRARAGRAAGAENRAERRPGGELRRSSSHCTRTPARIAVDPEGNTAILTGNVLQIYDAAGRRTASWQNLWFVWESELVFWGPGRDHRQHPAPQLDRRLRPEGQRGARGDDLRGRLRQDVSRRSRLRRRSERRRPGASRANGEALLFHSPAGDFEPTFVRRFPVGAQMPGADLRRRPDHPARR